MGPLLIRWRTVEGGEGVLGVSVNLLMSDSDGGLYSVHTTV